MGYTRAEGFQVLKHAALDIKYMIRTTLLSLKELVTGGLGVKDLGGPVGLWMPLELPMKKVKVREL